MSTIWHGSLSAHQAETIEIRRDPASHYVIYVDGERIASVFGKDGKLPTLVIPNHVPFSAERISVSAELVATDGESP